MHKPGADMEWAKLPGWRSAWRGVLLGLITGLPWLSLSWLGFRLGGVTMPPFALFDLLARALPGAMVTAGLEFMVRLLTQSGVSSTAQAAKTLETAMALLIALAVSALLGGLFGWLRQRQPIFSALPLGTSLGFSALLLAWWDDWGSSGILLGAAWTFTLGLAWGLTMDWLHGQQKSVRRETGLNRRGFLGYAALASAGFSLLSLGIARWWPAEQAGLVAAPFPPKPTPVPPPDAAAFTPVVGTRSELTPMLNFFRVDINLRSPRADQVSEQARQQARALAESMPVSLPDGAHLLAISGLVKEPKIISLEQVLSLERVDQFATLECISNPVAGDLIGTTLFSGARLNEVLALAGLDESVEHIVFRCADGYSESLPRLSALDDRTLLCYAMGGEALSEEHGFPFRLYTPNRFGMKNPKWIVAIEAASEEYQGYWQRRSWDEEAFVKTEAVIDAVVVESTGSVHLGGIAFTGSRGISRVEVRLDGGEWRQAVINRPLSRLAWVKWSLEITNPRPGNHLAETRATDGAGLTQTALAADPLPAGATGYHRRRFRVPG